ncbi:TetR/AcrR family transcriptional regulator [Nocardiopsis sp. ATB16-24]|uniref:TetR/AcrR family transcriptional regulator n=1 Tax=Nocardiopsis sp. ATB16-24 TaxID=3019555 RepID=UPI002555B1F8|nr:TetR/AcrR family transcriptional regulator [Nocardiopsis sp. ATB16-24]
MPRITAATLADHQANQRRAVLDAAKEVLAEVGGDAFSLSRVAARVGLARSSLYQYFGSRQDLLDALVEDLFPRWSQLVTGAMAGEASPALRVLAYADANLRLVADGEHAVAGALAAASPGADFAERSREMHEQLAAPLTEALEFLGVPDPPATAELVNAVIHKASRMIESGTAFEDASARIEEVLRPFLMAQESRRCPRVRLPR